MEARRDKITSLLAEHLPPLYAKDLEIGLYNWSLQQADAHHIVRNWANPKFVRIYVEKARSILSNLKADTYLENKTLRTRILEKEFLPHELPFMNPENIHPQRWEATVNKFMKKYKNAYEQKEEAMTEMFTCGRCKKNKCSFEEKQIRSGDEGMTLFIRCINCGHRWRQ